MDLSITGDEQTEEISLDKDVAQYYNAAYATNTQRAYASHRRVYLRFCRRMGYVAIPASTSTLCRYAAFLAKSMKFNSIKQYLNILRILHAEWKLPNPLENNYTLTCVLRGIRRHLGDTIVRKKPITPQLLQNILTQLDLTNSLDTTVWAAALTMFYGLLRKSNVFAPSVTQFDPDKHLRRKDIIFYPWGFLIHIRWSKTNQYKERIFDIPLPRLDKHSMCPVQAIILAAKQTRLASAVGPAFVYTNNGSITPLTSDRFIGRIRCCLQKCDIDTNGISCHSFRRGGATFGYTSGLSADAIKLLGDWRSECYHNYLENDVKERFKIIRHMQYAIKQ